MTSDSLDNASSSPPGKAPLGKRLGIAGIVVGACVGLGYALSHWIAPPSSAGGAPSAQVMQLSDLVEKGERLVLVGRDSEEQLRATLATYFEDARRDEVFQRAFASRFDLQENAYTVLLLTLEHGALPGEQAEESEASEADDDETEDEPNSEGNGALHEETAPPVEPLPLGGESVEIELADGDSRASVPLRSLLPEGDVQAALLAAAYAGTGELPWGKAVRRYVVLPGELDVASLVGARLTLADGRTLDLQPRTQRYPVPPGLAAGTTDAEGR